MRLKSGIRSQKEERNYKSLRKRPIHVVWINSRPAALILLHLSGFHIWTIGCQMNVADSRRLAESLEQYGLTAADGPHDADVVVLYSCVVRQGAEDRVHGQLHALQKMKAALPAMKVVVAGFVI